MGQLWTGGLSNPMDAIEQFSYLLFLQAPGRRREPGASGRPSAAGEPYHARASRRRCAGATGPSSRPARRWNTSATRSFPWFKNMGAEGSSFERYMQNAEFKINQPNLLIEACNAIDEMRISEQNQDVQGDLYEYLLGKLNTAGRDGQFRTPRHIIRMMVADDRPPARRADRRPGGGHLRLPGQRLPAHPGDAHLARDPGIRRRGLAAQPGRRPARPPSSARFCRSEAFRGYDNDSGMTMLRIGSMNLMLHGIEHPRFFYMDTLSKDFTEERRLRRHPDEPALQGRGGQGRRQRDLPDNTTKSELLFVHLILRALDMGGRCAVIVPDGVLFGSSRAHVELRKKLVEENRLDGVVSMPGGVFKPYAGVSTAVLLFTRGAETERDLVLRHGPRRLFAWTTSASRRPRTTSPTSWPAGSNRHDAEFQAAAPGAAGGAARPGSPR